MQWQEVNPGVQWVLIDENRIVRQVMKLGPYLGFPNATYRVTGGESYTDHATPEEAIAAAEASAREAAGD